MLSSKHLSAKNLMLQNSLDLPKLYQKNEEYMHNDQG
jgi:hypothetical protein